VVLGLVFVGVTGRRRPRVSYGDVAEVAELLVEEEKTCLHALSVVAATLGSPGASCSDCAGRTPTSTRTPSRRRETVQRVGARLLVDDTQAGASGVRVPLPKIARSGRITASGRPRKVEAGHADLDVTTGARGPRRDRLGLA
jgi:hypothetical protein